MAEQALAIPSRSRCTDEHFLYVGDGKNNLVYSVAYPSGKTLQTLSGFGRVHGVAVSPPAPK